MAGRAILNVVDVLTSFVETETENPISGLFEHIIRPVIGQKEKTTLLRKYIRHLTSSQEE